MAADLPALARGALFGRADQFFDKLPSQLGLTKLNRCYKVFLPLEIYCVNPGLVFSCFNFLSLSSAFEASGLKASFASLIAVTI
jgi:hypothetical protein